MPTIPRRVGARLLPALLCFPAACATAESAVPAAATPTQSVVTGESIDSTLARLTFDSAWSIVARAHYDTAYNGVDWDGVRTELRPRATAALTTSALRSVIMDMLGRLGESHFGLIPHDAASALASADDGAAGSARDGRAGVEFRLVGDGAAGDQLVAWRVDPAGAAAAAGVRTGWVVVSIDNRSVAPRLEALAALPQADRRVARTRLQMQMNAELTGAAGDRRPITFRRGDDTVAERTLVLRPGAGDMIVFGSLPPTLARLQADRVPIDGGCAGVIRLSVWLVPLSPQFDRAVDELRDCAGIVVDLRGNPGGVAGMVMGAAGHFVNDTLPLGYMKTRTAELRFKANPRRVRADGTRTEPFAGRLAVLTDELTASTSEFFADGLQALGRARVFGTRSAGQALPALLTQLPNGDVMMYVVADFTGPHGSRIEGRGVVPDVVVETTLDDLLQQRDAPLMAALDWIADGAAGTPERGRRP